MLHTVNSQTFKRQVRAMSALGNLVSLDQVYSGEGLGRVNFCITFDDVSNSIKNITPFLSRRKIPYLIAPCGLITDEGRGIRDKVYFISKFINVKAQLSFVRNTLGENFKIKGNDFTFYHFSKDPKYNPDWMTEKIINPLYNTISPSLIDKFELSYLSWQEIKSDFLGDPLVTIANHSWGHKPMDYMGQETISQDIIRSFKSFEKNLGITPRYYCVPFGGIVQNLAYDLTQQLRKFNCKGILWSEGGINLVDSPFNNQLLQITRIHAHTSLLRFFRQIFVSIKSRHVGIKNSFLQKNLAKGERFRIVEGNDIEPVRTLENFVRYGKDYASDPKFFKYMFSDNPFKDILPDYYAVVSKERVSSIGYNFHSQFQLVGKIFPGAYFGGWRRLPESSQFGAFQIFLKTISQSPIVGCYKPNKLAEKAFNNKGWKKIQVGSYQFSTKKLKVKGLIPQNNYDLEIFNHYPKVLNNLLREVNRRYFFSLHRTPEFYEWRFDNYKLNDVCYFVSSIQSQPNGYFVVLTSNSIAHISDFYADNIETFKFLLMSMYQVIKNKKISETRLDTTLPFIAQWLEVNLSPKVNFFNTYYHFNRKTMCPEIFNNVSEKWNEEIFHETLTCSDILLR
jgi:peptidoglycan/xylan/chitin deacetylase (PgdA/CDA1 family)